MKRRLRLPSLRMPRLTNPFTKPPFARPTRADWARDQVRTLGDTVSRRARTAWSGAAHATADAAQAADHAALDARDRMKAAAKDALAQARYGAPKRPRRSGAAKPKPPERKAKARPPKPKGPGPIGTLEGAALLVLAGVILAWPRPGQRTPLEKLRGVARPLSEAPADAQGAVAERSEPGRGRSASSPWRIPPKGWRDVLTRTWSEFNADQIPAVAGGVTFFSLLAMFPALAAFVSLYGLFADASQARQQLRLLAGFMPHDILNFVGDEMLQIAGAHQGSLGVAFVVSLAVSLWSANGAVKALFYGLNIAYEERERRNLLVLNLTSMAFTLGAIAFMLAAFTAVVVVPVLLARVGLDLHTVWVAELRWPILLVLLIVGLSTVYRYGPSREHSRWRWITPGGIFTGLLWVAASLLFSWYVSNFGHFNKTYGSLGAVIGFMVWLWYSTIIVLLGAELNAELEHQTAVDSTTGAPRPLGARGARMADTLGRSAHAKPKAASGSGPVVGR